ncbi:MAG: hypothetical protein V4773_06280 [Verrucomicrobiota bacterium]
MLGKDMSDTMLISYFSVGLVSAIGCRILLHRLKTRPTPYWRILLGGGTEAIIVTLFLWPITLLALVLYHVLKKPPAVGDGAGANALEAERQKRERENSTPRLSLDELLKKVEEQKAALKASGGSSSSIGQ